MEGTGDILIGECKCSTEAVDCQTVRDLIERTVPLTVADLPDKGAGWQVTPALFACTGATPAARKTLEAAKGGGSGLTYPVRRSR